MEPVEIITALSTTVAFSALGKWPGFFGAVTGNILYHYPVWS